MALLEYKCPNCGGAIVFDAASQEMVCPYCDTTMDMVAMQAMDAEIEEQQTSEKIDWGYDGDIWGAGEQDGMAVYSCQSCSGEIVADETLGATSCPFCGNPVVMLSKFSGTLRPDVVIPFKKTRDEAVKALKGHYLGKQLLPKVFKDTNHLEEIRGVYVPFWLFDADADARIEYKATRLRKWSDSKYNYLETSEYRVFREGSLCFDAVPVDGSTAIDDALMESIEPFDIQEGVDFQTAYLAGYFANKYDVDAEQSIQRANDRIKNSTEAAFHETVSGYDIVTAHNTWVNLKSGSIRYALLPVWLLTTKWNGDNYIFAMNGQTGRFVGNLPLDKSLYKSWFLKIFGGVAAVLIALSFIIFR